MIFSFNIFAKQMFTIERNNDNVKCEDCILVVSVNDKLTSGVKEGIECINSCGYNGLIASGSHGTILPIGFSNMKMTATANKITLKMGG